MEGLFRFRARLRPTLMTTRDDANGPQELHAKIYVVTDIKHLATTGEGEQTWWCTGYACNPGDIGIIYVKEIGVKYVFRFIRFDDQNTFCKRYGMATACVELLKVLDDPVSPRDLRSMPEFRQMKAVRRNFQSRWFDIEEDILAAFLNRLGVSLPQHSPAAKTTGS